MSAEQFLKLAEERGLLDQRVIGSLRQQLRAKGPGNVTAQQIAQLLIQKERLTRYQAAKLVDDALKGPVADDMLELVEDEADDALVVTELNAIPIEPAGEPSGLPPQKVSVSSKASQRGDTDQGVVDLAALSASAGTLDSGPNPSAPFARKGAFAQLQGLLRGVRGSRPMQRWDSNLMLFGGGALLLLTFLGILLYFMLSQGGGDEMMDLAQADYDAQSYSQAIAKYEKFIKRYPKHPKRSLATVRVTLAKMRRNTESQNWEEALKVAKAELPGLTQEDAFAEARSELAGILPSIYEGFVSQGSDARELSQKESYLALAKEASGLVDSPEYLPSSLRRGLQDRLDTIKQAAELAQRDVDREHKLAETISAITESASNKEIARAYAARDELLQLFPSLREHRGLGEALQGLSRQEGNLIEIKDGSVPTTSDRSPAPWAPRVLILNRVIATPVASDGVRYVLSGGYLYALAMRDGNLLWRRALGNIPLASFVTNEFDVKSDVVLFDFHLGALVRLSALSGKLVWQLPLPSEPLDLQIVGETIMAPTNNQELHSISWETGFDKIVATPQEISVAPGTLASTGEWILPAIDSTAYIIDPKTLKCRDAVRWGHAKGTIQSSPTSLSNFVLFVENAGADFCLLHTWNFPADPKQPAKRVGEPIRLIGNVRQPIGISGERFAIVTDRQAIYVFQLELANPEKPPIQIAALEAKSEQPIPSFIRFTGDQVLVAGQGLAEYRLVASAGRLNPTWIVEKNAMAMALPAVTDDGTIVCNFVQPSADGVVAKAIRSAGAAGDQEPVSWSVELGAEPDEEPVVSSALKAVIHTGSNGRVWVVDAANFKSGLAESCVTPSTQGLPLRAPVTAGLSDLWFPVGDGSSRGFRLSSVGSPRELMAVKFDPQDRHPVMIPLAFGGGVLLGMREGSIHLIDPQTGKSETVPFQPATSPGQRSDWLRPSLAGANNEYALVAEQAGGVYLLEVNKSSPPALMAKQEMTIGPRLISGIASVGSHAVVVQRTDAKDMLVVLSLTPLVEKDRVDVPSRVVGGPWRVAEFVVVELANGELLAINESGQVQWTKQLPRSPLAGPPLSIGKQWICVGVQGALFRLNATDGVLTPWGERANEEGILEIGETMGCGAVLFASRLLLTARDGALFVVDAPQ